MPIPKPINSETREEFMDRCLSDDKVNEEFPDTDQRYAACSTQWRDRDKKDLGDSKMDKKIKYFSSKAKSVDGEDRVLRFIGSTETMDRDKEIIKASGWKLQNYKKNPVVLVNHKYSDLPVAKTKKVWVEDKQLMFDIEFPDPEISSMGDTLFKLYKNGFMNATSVGFAPNVNKIEYGKTAEGPRAIFHEQELLEISLVSVPANPTALLTSKGIQKAVKEDIIDELELKELEEFLKSLDIDNINLNKNEKNEDLVQTDYILNINKSEEDNYLCKSCGTELQCLCDKCIENKERKEFIDFMDKLLGV